MPANQVWPQKVSGTEDNAMDWTFIEDLNPVTLTLLIATLTLHMYTSVF